VGRKVTLDMPEEDYEILADIAKYNRSSMSQVIRSLIVRGLGDMTEKTRYGQEPIGDRLWGRLLAENPGALREHSYLVTEGAYPLCAVVAVPGKMGIQTRVHGVGAETDTTASRGVREWLRRRESGAIDPGDLAGWLNAKELVQ
jgi:hypothetical protein